MALSYQTLSEAQIRLLYLQPRAEKNAIIETNLQVVSLAADAAAFEALSYVWGTKMTGQAIKCDDVVIDASENLANALRHLRHPDRVRVLWVDAICINQGDNGEKSQQVALMGNIYKHAERVVVWLGPAEHNSDVVFDQINERFERLLSSSTLMRLYEAKERYISMGVDFDAIKRHLARRAAADSNHATRNVLDSLSRFAVAISIAEEPDDMKTDLALMMLLQRPWWTRVWIIQELCLGSEVMLMCGDSSAPWEAFTFAIAASQSAKDNSGLTDSTAISRYRSLANTRVRLSGLNGWPSLLEALGRFRWFRATQPIDKVYSLLGITESLGITPDYRINAEACYKETARKIISHSDTLDILDYTTPTYPVKIPDNLPSWVPDWSQEDSISDQRSILGYSGLSSSNYVLREKYPPILSSQARFSDEGMLVLKGIIIDSVGSLHGAVLLPSLEPPVPPVTTSNPVRGFISLCRYYIQYATVVARVLHRVGEFAVYGQSLMKFAERAVADRQQPDEGNSQDPRLRSVIRLLHLFARDLSEDSAPTIDDAKLFIKAQEKMADSIVCRLLGYLRPLGLLPLYHFILGVLTTSYMLIGEGDRVQNGWDVLALNACSVPGITSAGRLCLITHTCNVGDQVALLRGGRHPYVVRDMGNHKWMVIGPCFVSHEDMDELRMIWSDEKADEMAFI